LLPLLSAGEVGSLLLLFVFLFSFESAFLLIFRERALFLAVGVSFESTFTSSAVVNVFPVI
jgi:hypothetical protein